MLNACWVFPIHPDLDREGRALDAALAWVVGREAQSPTGERFLNLPEGIDTEKLASWGFVKEADLYLYALTRAGLHRFVSFNTARYGGVEAASRRRTARRSLAGGGRDEGT
jgi:hypothetical protein